METSEIILSISAAAFASSGLWTFINNVWQSRSKKKSAEQRALLGLLHDKVYYLSEKAIKKGSISREEYENLRYIYDPYIDMGGNGTGKRLFEEVNGLPLREE